MRTLILLLVMTIGVIGAESVFANTHQTTLKPGDTYDCGKAKANTSVYINKPGKYTLKGSTRYVRIVICCGDVTCYLDGVNMNAGASTYVGKWASPLNVVDDGGTVTLISKKGTKNYFEGYNMPGIRKEGTNTELVFETEDPNHPGEIEVKAGSSGAAAIGSTQKVQFGKSTCGNFTFNSGKVIARSQQDGAAIGGGACVACRYVRINGGEVKAYGWGNGAAIGGGDHGGCRDIEINGGIVYAENGWRNNNYGAAAIGSGGGTTGGASPGVNAYNMYFRGGEVTAISHSIGAAIGGGKNRGASYINFLGSKVTAINKDEGPAIGAGNGYGLKVDRLNFYSGEVTAKGGKDMPAIGARKPNMVDDNTININIKGGKLTATGGSGSDWDIGGGCEDTCTTISGGTVHAERIQGRAVITGGSVYANEIQEGAKNDDGVSVHRLNVKIDGVDDEDVPVYKFKFRGDYTYGSKDIVTLAGGYIYPWFISNPNAELRMAYIDNGRELLYYGSIPLNTDGGTMHRATDITLETKYDYQSFEKGSAHAVPGEDSLQAVTKPGIPSKSVAIGYYTANGHKVADMKGKLEKGVPNYTDESGKWISGQAVYLTLYCKTRPFQYSVHFDANPPKSASTKGNVSGSMEDLTECNYNQRIKLPPNGFVLPGYEFDGWNTKADGTGKEYEDEEFEVRNLSDEDGGTATLYAQWRPKKYNVTLDSGAINKGSFTSSDFTFDERGVIPNLPDDWTTDYMSFHCWADENGNYYDREANVFNLVKYDTNNNPIADGDKLKGQTLTALWIEHGKIAVTVTIDGEPKEGLGTHFKLKDKNDPDAHPYSPEFRYESGVYIYESPDDEGDPNYVPPGEYNLLFNPGTAQYLPVSTPISYQLDSTASAIFDYHTVSIETDPVLSEGICNVDISGVGFIAPGTNKKVFVPDDVNLVIKTYMNPDYGYHFDGYSVLGIKPGNEDNTDTMDRTAAEQIITVRGAANIMAHAEANKYTVHFDANAESGTTGEMENQDMVYDTTQNLFANRFERIGGEFTGWNTKETGDGTPFEDGAAVKNMTKEKDGKVSLYAQWDLQQYGITYDLDGGHLPNGAVNPEKYTAADSFTLINPEQDEYMFMGWSGTDIAGRSKTVTIPADSIGDREYIACWTPVQYYVYFESNGGSYVEPEIVPIHDTVTKPANPTRGGFTFQGWYADKELTKAFDFKTEITEETTLYAKWKKTASPSKSKPVLIGQGTSSGKKAIKVSWNKVPGAKEYLLYGAQCKGNAKRIKVTKGTSFKVTKAVNRSGKLRKLKPHRAYKFIVVAVDKKGRVLATSKTFHVITAKTMGKKYANIKSIKANKTKITLKKGATVKVGAKYKLPKGKRHISKEHGAYLRYTSNNPGVASVNRNGKVKAKAKGEATIYIQDTCGKYCKTVVTVK